ncbi:MAG: DUF2157 domain-containing protein [Planctomycetota bacterium]
MDSKEDNNRYSESFYKKLLREIPYWIEKGIINEEQKQELLKIYKVPETEMKEIINEEQKRGPLKIYKVPETDMKRKAPIILVSLACILLVAGLFLFYAANWQYMTPEFKLFQVFLLISGIYTASYFALNHPNYVRLGRVLLVMGMASFGGGIALVAQIYHIAAHGGTGLLLWTLGAMLMSWVTREKWGYYFASLIAFIWTCEKFFYYQHHNYLFPVIAIFLGVAFYRLNAQKGMLIVLSQLIFWIFQWNICQIQVMGNVLRGANLEKITALCLLLQLLPFGLILVCLGRMLQWKENLSFSSQFLTQIGWIFFFVPLLGLSWTFPSLEQRYPILIQELYVFHLEYILFTVLFLFCILKLYRKESDYSLPLAAFFCGNFLYFLPIGDNHILMIVSHLSLLSYLYCFLFFSHSSQQPRKSEKNLGFAFMNLVLISKAILFFSFGIESRQFFLTYCIGFIMFATVCFLLTLVVKQLLEKRGILFNANTSTSYCIGLTFFIVYLLSFKIENQSSVLEAKLILLIMLTLFFTLALLLYIFLYLRSKEKLMLTLSSITFALSTIILFISGPDVSWITYSLAFNFLLFSIEGTLIYYGIKVNSSQITNFGIAGFLLHVGTRYFDILFDMFSGSLLFIVTGLLVLGCGFLLERKNVLIKKLK